MFKRLLLLFSFFIFINTLAFSAVRLDWWAINDDDLIISTIKDNQVNPSIMVVDDNRNRVEMSIYKTFNVISMTTDTLWNDSGIYVFRDGLQIQDASDVPNNISSPIEWLSSRNGQYVFGLKKQNGETFDFVLSMKNGSFLSIARILDQEYPITNLTLPNMLTGVHGDMGEGNEFYFVQNDDTLESFAIENRQEYINRIATERLSPLFVVTGVGRYQELPLANGSWGSYGGILLKGNLLIEELIGIADIDNTREWLSARNGRYRVILTTGSGDRFKFVLSVVNGSTLSIQRIIVPYNDLGLSIPLTKNGPAIGDDYFWSWVSAVDGTSVDSYLPVAQ